ncbi:response regulator [Novosphingobium olei]|uniref:Response regulator n=1 Tax=Novosphingobium olei TaxID=2728851 RepID=A0A7Y0BLJ8_9SPHN|nr:response regulator [Novosphingobium olei]NML92697.1 response regulator [Novosphingobium olei]BEV01445.1 response regulator [Novosphingobium olei]
MSDLPCQVLVLDDEPLILLDLEFAVEDAGCVPLTALEADEALEIVAAEEISAAILDVSLGQGRTCEPVARALAAMGIPYVLHTGDLDRMDEAVRELGGVLVPKPTPAAVVVSRALQGLIAQQRRAG